jgi:hypothetical protein
VALKSPLGRLPVTVIGVMVAGAVLGFGRLVFARRRGVDQAGSVCAARGDRGQHETNRALLAVLRRFATSKFSPVRCRVIDNHSHHLCK